MEGRLKDGKQDGVWMTWHENGQKSREANYNAGNSGGPFAMWFPSGEIKREGSFTTDGRKDGT